MESSVENAAKRTQMLTGEKVPQDPLARIQNYLNRFHEIIDQKDPARKEHTLELCPAEVGTHYGLSYTNQPMEEWFYIAMKQFAGRNGYPHVFGVGRGPGGLWLYSDWAVTGYGWRPEARVVFALSKSEPKKLGLLDRFLRH